MPLRVSRLAALQLRNAANGTQSQLLFAPVSESSLIPPLMRQIKALCRTAHLKHPCCTSRACREGLGFQLPSHWLAVAVGDGPIPCSLQTEGQTAYFTLFSWPTSFHPPPPHPLPSFLRSLFLLFWCRASPPPPLHCSPGASFSRASGSRDVG